MKNKDATEDNDLFLLSARRAGLEKAVTQFPADVAVAMATARQVQDALDALGAVWAAPNSAAALEDAP